ncbi:sensor histidine kinase [Flintibacter muris]|uniref:sensor histidine kinase n=1 Tax=Flintibacter muris TaxID=2941327 RepID=UPI00203AEEA7|nr:sensor histidine kinase [Flintibacter muris]
MTRPFRRPASIRGRLRGLIFTFVLLAILILAAAMSLMVRYNSRYKDLLYNVTTASEFNQDFKTSIDLKMYYYVIESRYSEGLPLDEVRAAQQLARDLLSTTVDKDSRMAISSVLSLCRNLEEKIYELRDTSSYDERQSQLENNIYVLTALIQEYMYNYLYYEAVRLNVLQSQISREMVGDFLLIAALAGLLVLFVTWRAARLGRSITRPIADLCHRVAGINSGDLADGEPIRAEEYEIRTLSQGFEQMVGRLNRQIRETSRNQESLRRAELALIQAQVNPHFLYNTMDTIIWLIEAEKTEEAVEMVSSLSSFFRHSLSRGQDVITLREEEEHVRSYLQIQQARYKDIMRYTINISPELEEAVIPKLTLQPLVENALYHGIKLKRGPGRIYVVGQAQGEDILLQVTDDGAGMSPERLEELTKALDQGERVGFGLSTVHERVRLFFGPPYGLSISSQQGVGTTISVRVPLRREASP